MTGSVIKFGFGQPVPRTEDARLLTGGGRYTDDVVLPNEAYLYLYRSPVAHADITALNVDAAREAEGVLAVMTIDELEANGVGPMPIGYKVTQTDGTLMKMPTRHALAKGRVRHVGEPIVAIVAETMNQARDAAELIEFDFEDLPTVVDTAGALDADAPQIFDEAPNNICFVWDKGDAAAVEEAFAKADQVVGVDLINNRVSANPLEGRASIGAFDSETGKYTLYVSSQGVHGLKAAYAKVMGVEAEQMHVITTDVGGGFGMKIFPYPEYSLVLLGAKLTGRPVKWISERTEAFISDDHGRDHVTHAEMAMDSEGHFLGLRVKTTAAMGAYISYYAGFIPTDAGTGMLAGQYKTPAIHCTVTGVFTNTNPTDAYRGAGRPEASYVIERVVDACGRATGLGPAEIRRRNFIPAEAMPYKTALDLTYDTGEFHNNLEDALQLGDVAGIDARKTEARSRGKLRGLGFASYIEACSGGGPEEATMEVGRDGKITLLIGTQSNGQGHDTAYKQIVAERLGVAAEDITVIQGDSERVKWGSGTGGSRSVPVGGAAASDASYAVIDKAKGVAADMLEAAAVDLEFAEGRFTIAGTDRSVSFTDVAAQAAGDEPLAFNETVRWKPPANTYPNGVHVVELDVDIDTGTIDFVNYTVVDDFGTMLNPMLVAGQVHGGVGQGIGQAVTEEIRYDPESGQLITGSFMDYGMPRADRVPMITIKFNRVPSTTNSLGMKGAGEAGAIGACPAVINAIIDALSAVGVSHVDMPATPEKLWRLIHENMGKAAAE